MHLIAVLLIVLSLASPIRAKKLATIQPYAAQTIRNFQKQSKDQKLDLVRRYVIEMVTAPDFEEVNWFRLARKNADSALISNLDSLLTKDKLQDSLLPRLCVVYDSAVLIRNQHGNLPSWLIPIAKSVRSIVKTLKSFNSSTPGLVTKSDAKHLRTYVNEMMKLMDLVEPLAWRQLKTPNPNLIFGGDLEDL